MAAALRRVIATSVFAGAVAAGQGASAEEKRSLERTLGIGSAQGQTVAGGTLYTAPDRVGGAPHAILFGMVLPTLELRYFPGRLYSIDFSTSLTGSIFAAAFDHALYFTQDAFVTFHLGRRVARFLAGPGLGFSTAFREDDSGAQTGASLRVVAQFGLEIATKNQAFGFEVLARPWVEVTHSQSRGEEHTFASGGFANLIALFGYFRQ